MELTTHDRYKRTVHASEAGVLVHAGYNAATRRLTLQFRYPGGSMLSLRLSQEEAREVYKRLKPSGETNFQKGITGPEATITRLPLRKWTP